MKKWLKEPLLHFSLLGSLIFLYYELSNSEADNEEGYEIIIDKSDIDRLISTYSMNWNQTPDSTTLERLIDDEIQSEIMNREAKRLNLHHNDEIIRRRLRQKYEFLVKDLAEASAPSDEELKAFYEKNKATFSTETKRAFFQFYSEVPISVPFINKTLISNPRELSHFTAFHISTYQSLSDKLEIAKSLGQSFADQLFSIEKTGWHSTPVSSGFGHHMVYIQEVSVAQLLPFERVQSRVVQHWKEQRAKEYQATIFQNLREKYNIEVVR